MSATVAARLGVRRTVEGRQSRFAAALAARQSSARERRRVLRELLTKNPAP